MTLPKDVQRVVNRHGREYFYYQPKRGTKNAGKRVPLGSDTSDPEFWRRLQDTKTAPTPREGTFSALIAGWRQQNWARLRPASRKNFNHFLTRLDAEAGDRVVANLTRRDIYLMLDGMSATPNSANYMLAVLRVLLEWGVHRGYRDDNPAIGVKRLRVEDRGHEPWPEEGYRFVITQAPTHLQRMAFLGRATGQRVSDLVKMRPADLAPDGITLKIGKLRDKKHFVPLTARQMAEIRSWGVRDLDFFTTTPAGRRCSATYIIQIFANSILFNILRTSGFQIHDGVYKFNPSLFSPIAAGAGGRGFIRKAKIACYHFGRHADLVRNCAIFGASTTEVVDLGCAQTVDRHLEVSQRFRVWAVAPVIPEGVH